jgi:hypothetical protein
MRDDDEIDNTCERLIRLAVSAMETSTTSVDRLQLAALERELEQTAASAGVRPGKGWQARLRREQLHLPGPDVDGWDPGLMLRWFKFLPPAVQTRAVLLEKLEW